MVDIAWLVTILFLVTLSGIAAIVRRPSGQDVSGWVAAIVALDALVATTFFSAQGELAAERSERLTTTQVQAETNPVLVMFCGNSVKADEAPGQLHSVVGFVPNTKVTGNTEVPASSIYDPIECVISNVGRMPALNGHIYFPYSFFRFFDLRDPSAVPTRFYLKYADVPILGIGPGGRFIVWLSNTSCASRDRIPMWLTIRTPTTIEYATPLAVPTTVPLTSQADTSYSIPPQDVSHGMLPHCLR